jgi:hypothetical protein
MRLVLLCFCLYGASVLAMPWSAYPLSRSVKAMSDDDVQHEIMKIFTYLGLGSKKIEEKKIEKNPFAGRKFTFFTTQKFIMPLSAKDKPYGRTIEKFLEKNLYKEIKDMSDKALHKYIEINHKDIFDLLNLMIDLEAKSRKAEAKNTAAIIYAKIVIDSMRNKNVQLNALESVINFKKSNKHSEFGSDILLAKALKTKRIKYIKNRIEEDVLWFVWKNLKDTINSLYEETEIHQNFVGLENQPKELKRLLKSNNIRKSLRGFIKKTVAKFDYVSTYLNFNEDIIIDKILKKVEIDHFKKKPESPLDKFLYHYLIQASVQEQRVFLQFLRDGFHESERVLSIDQAKKFMQQSLGAIDWAGHQFIIHFIDYMEKGKYARSSLVVNGLKNKIDGQLALTEPRVLNDNSYAPKPLPDAEKPALGPSFFAWGG